MGIYTNKMQCWILNVWISVAYYWITSYMLLLQAGYGSSKQTARRDQKYKCLPSHIWKSMWICNLHVVYNKYAFLKIVTRWWLHWPLLEWSMSHTVTPNWQDCCRTVWEATARQHWLPQLLQWLAVTQNPSIHSSLLRGRFKLVCTITYCH